MDVRDTHVTRTGGKSVACTQLSRRRSFAFTKNAMSSLLAPKIRTEAVLTTYGFFNVAYVFARGQHAVARTVGCDRGFTDDAKVDFCGCSSKSHNIVLNITSTYVLLSLLIILIYIER